MPKTISKETSDELDNLILNTIWKFIFIIFTAFWFAMFLSFIFIEILCPILEKK